MITNKDLNYRLYIQREEDFKRTSFSREFERYRAISSGDVEQVKRNFAELRTDFHKGKGTLSDDPVRDTRYHFIIAAALISRLCIQEGMNHDVAYTLSDIYIRRADKCDDLEALLEMNGEMLVDFAERMREIKRKSATSIHIRRCIDYIYDHLSEKLTVVSAAEYLGIDPTYLSKLFVRETGIGFRKFINNAKIGIAKNMIKDSELSFLEISLALGFSSQSAFITTFKKITGETPGHFKEICHDL